MPTALNGIRYNPAGEMGPEYKVTGGGVWSTVNFSSKYNWTETPSYERPIMFYVKEGEKGTLAYAFSTVIGPKGLLCKTLTSPAYQDKREARNVYQSLIVASLVSRPCALGPRNGFASASLVTLERNAT